MLCSPFVRAATTACARSEKTRSLRCGAAHLKIIQRFLQHASIAQSTTALARGARAEAAHSTARKPVQPHLHSSHAIPRHTLHHTHSPAPHHAAAHIHICRCSGQSLARGCNTAEHESHWHAYRNFGERVAKGQQRFLPMARVAHESDLSSKNLASTLMSWRAYLICARNSAGDSA